MGVIHMTEHVVIHPPGRDRKEKKKIGFRLSTHLIHSPNLLDDRCA
jgi:hypothetical protein